MQMQLWLPLQSAFKLTVLWGGVFAYVGHARMHLLSDQPLQSATGWTEEEVGRVWEWMGWQKFPLAFFISLFCTGSSYLPDWILRLPKQHTILPYRAWQMQNDLGSDPVKPSLPLEIYISHNKLLGKTQVSNCSIKKFKYIFISI